MVELKFTLGSTTTFQDILYVSYFQEATGLNM
jgi:hypothetical protein